VVFRKEDSTSPFLPLYVLKDDKNVCSSPHWTCVVGYGLFSLCMIHTEGSTLMMMMMMKILVVTSEKSRVVSATKSKNSTSLFLPWML
jgi:hypothetical protein